MLKQLKRNRMKRFFKSVVSMLLLAAVMVSCTSKKTETTVDTKERQLEWTRNANIYEVNIRQYTPEGTIKAFEAHLPRLKEMGVEILWLMPIFPISEKERKGSMGSCYAVADYQLVNPDYGTLEDFKKLVEEAHKLDMKIILDWVANHTGWDNHIMAEHKEWYTQNEKGEVIMPAGTDWSDTADLNYDNKDLRKYMIESLEYWLREANIDGYRCDMAAMVPTGFWEDARKQLDKIKPVFMLAEAWEPELVNSAFDMAYGWDFHHMMNDIAKGEKNVADIDKYFAKIDTLYPEDSYMMNFLTNHDENSWAGTINERMGDSQKAFAALIYTIPGMPLIYTGQEAGLSHKLLFFEKDQVDWTNEKLMPFYTALNKLKASNKALQNGKKGGALVRLSADKAEQVYAFSRESEGDKIVVIMNLSAEALDAKVSGASLKGKYTEYFTNDKVDFSAEENMNIKAWEYKVFVK